jgi:hypothetical protein
VIEDEREPATRGDDEPTDPGAVEREPDVPAELERRWHESGARWAADLAHRQTRRSWLVPLLAVPTAQIAVASRVPPAFLLLSPDELESVRERARTVLAAADRSGADPGADLTADEALAALDLALSDRGLLSQVFALTRVTAELLGLPAGLAGEGLVRRLAQAITERPEPPAWLAVLALPLLDDLTREDKGREFVPLPHAFFTPIARAFDRRCYELGLRSWASALSHAATVWTAGTWHDALLAYSMGTVPSMLAGFLERTGPSERLPSAGQAPRSDSGGTRSRRRDGAERELVRLREELAAAREQVEAARREAAAARLREAELIHARDRAQSRVGELTARTEELARRLHESQSQLQAERATLRRLSAAAAPEAPEPAPVSPAPLPDALLRGRTVFFFTGQERGAAARAQADALRALGAEDVRLYEFRQGRPGPDAFPAGAVVVVDVRFVGHQHTVDIEARVRRSDVIYVPLQAGEGGLAARLAERLAGGGQT